MKDLWFRGQLEELLRDECLDLVGTTTVGRIAYPTSSGVAVLPVNHAVIAGQIVVRISPSGQTARYLRELGPDAEVSYEVDAFDAARQTGWSVLVVGTAHDADLEALTSPTDRPVPWPSGTYWEYVRIRPGRVTGRRLAPV